MITTSPYSDGHSNWSDTTKRPDGSLYVKAKSNGPVPVKGKYSVGELIIRPMEIQKGDRVHALPWAWDQLSLENREFFATWKTHLERDYNGRHIVKGSYDQNVTPMITVSEGDLYAVRALPADLVQQIKSTAILKAQASLQKQVASLPLLFVERKQTLKTVGGYAKFILNNAITMQRKDVKKWLAALKRKSTPNQMKALANQIANRHLEFVFGVLPLLSEIEDSLDHFSKPTVTVRTGRGRDRRVIQQEAFKPHIFGGGYDGDVPRRGTIRTTTIQDFSSRCDLRCEIKSETLNNASLLGFNPLYAWYDLTPLSFVVGWFSNFNTWVQSLDPAVGLEYVTGSSSHKDVRTVSRSLINISAPYTGNKSFDVVSCNGSPSNSHVNSGSKTVFNREVHSKMPGIQPLYFVNKNSLFTVAASVSLLVQRLVNESNEVIKAKPFRYRGRKPKNLPPIRYRKV